jgi:hypothetical protein
MAMTMRGATLGGTLTATAATRTTLEEEPKKGFWNRIGWVDLMFVGLMTFITIRVWAYILRGT